MRPELETYHLIDRFLRGELLGEELAVFESELASSSELREELEFQKMVNTVVVGSSSDVLRDRIRKDLEQLDHKKSVYKKLIIGAGALLAILISAYFYKNIALHENIKPRQEERTKSVTLLKRQEKRVQDSRTESREKVPVDLHSKQVGYKPVVVQNTAKNTQSKVYIEKLNVTAQIENKAISEIKSVEIDTKSSTPTILDPCTGLKFFAKPTIKPTCEGEANGKVLYTETEIKGGTEPYRISLGKNNFTSRKEAFYDLASGDYLFYIRDANGCEQSVSVYVPEIQCKINKFTFNPDHGEVWKIPNTTGQSSIISILDRSGVLRFKKILSESSNEEWDGTDTKGVVLESGIYVYVIEYQDGKKENGQVTIVR